jgi:hypothetical protein
MIAMTRQKQALLIATYEYQDDLLRRLVAPARDAQALAKVLQDPGIGGFEVRILLNKPSYEINQELELFFADRRKDDLLLLYFSCHGIKDEDGALYFATPNTRHGKLRSTAVRANDVNDFMLRSRSRHQVLVLDCCYSGAFAKGMVAKGEKTIGTGEYFEGSGRVILTASDSMQYSFEGEEVEGAGIRSVFTRALVHGLESGGADLDNDGAISVDELYDYASERVRYEAPQQSPRRWFLDVEGKIIIASNPGPLKPAVLPLDLQQLINGEFALARLKAVDELSALLRGEHKGLALAARAALTRLATDDSRSVSSAAETCLAAQVKAPSLGEGAIRRIPQESLTYSVKSSRLALVSTRVVAVGRVLAACFISLVLGIGSEIGTSYIVAGASWDWFYYISAGVGGTITGAIYAFVLFDRFPVARLHTYLLGGSWALGWTMMAHSGFDPLAGVLGGAFIPLLAVVRRRS